LSYRRTRPPKVYHRSGGTTNGRAFQQPGSA